VIICPFSGEQVVALPALYPDVAAIHVHEADMFGNCRIRGTSVADFELARAAKRLIITCERLLPTEEFRREPHLTVIPFFCVDAVCEVPYGSYPGNMPGEYFSDEAHLKHWLQIEKNLEQYLAFLNEYLFDMSDFDSYLTKCGGLKRLQQLREQEFLFTPVS
jgi:glutaconate CoA-transferase, subunit A